MVHSLRKFRNYYRNVLMNQCSVYKSFVFTGAAHEAYIPLKHTTILFSLSDHYILSREWRVIVDLVQTSYHGRLLCYHNQTGVTELLL